MIPDQPQAVVQQTNLWRTSTHDEIRADVTVGEKRLDIDDVDVLFHNKAARRAFSAFLGPVGNMSSTFSIIQLARADAWMTTILEDLKKKCRGSHVSRGLDTMILKLRYNYLLPHAVCNLQKEVVQNMRKAMKPHKADYVFFDTELKIIQGSTADEILANNHRTYTVAAFYPPRGVYYIALRAASFKNYICSWLPNTRDCYIGYCEKPGTTMVEFRADGHEAGNNEDLQSDDMIEEL